MHHIENVFYIPDGGVVNITELAKQLGLSVGTISKALNGYPGVSEKTRELVKAGAKKYGYHPLDSARTLRKRCTDRIGLLTPSMGSGDWEQRVLGEHFLRILGGVVKEAEKYHKDLMLYTTQPMIHPETIERIATSREVDGLIVLGGKLPTEADQIIKSTGIPFVLQGKDSLVDEVSFVCPDMFMTGYLATKHLIEKGHTHIAYIGQSMDVESDPLRRKGYKSALQEFGIPYNPLLDVDSEFKEQGGARALQELMQREIFFSAIVFYSDGIYFEALQEYRDFLLGKGNTIGKATVGIDNIYQSRWSEPGLTSIHLPLEEMGSKAVEILIKLLESPKKRVIQETLPVSLVVRETSFSLK